MAGTVTLEQVRELVSQLPPAERLRLVSEICADLSATATPLPHRVDDDGLARRAAEAAADSLLAELDRIAESTQVNLDAVEDMRDLRRDRIEGR